MKKLKLFAAAMISILLAAPAQAQNGFEIKRGVNVSHWLSQSQARGQDFKDKGMFDILMK